MSRLNCFFALGSLLLAVSRASAVVEADLPLRQLVEDSQVVAVAMLEQVDRESGKGVFAIEQVLRGDEPLASLPVKLLRAGSGEGSPSDMLDRVDEGTVIVLFISRISPTEHQILAYTNGSWFMLRGVDQGMGLRALLFAQGEPYLKRTFAGEVSELIELISDHAVGTGSLPEIDKSAKPGLGPTLHNSPPPPADIASEFEQVELGPAWTNADGSAPQSNSPTLNYAVGVLLLAAGLGLAFMITRSSPGTAP